MHPISDVNQIIRHRWAMVNYIADTYSRFYLHPRNNAILADIKKAKEDNEESDRELRDHFLN